jgi:archaellum component FlaF (FlaF/FlaG flagellin family)
MRRARVFASLILSVGVVGSAVARAGETTRVSVDSAGVQGNSESSAPSISTDGRFVAFYSRASNLVPGDTNGTYDVFVHDRARGQISRVSVDSAGVQGNNLSGEPSISADGRFVAFHSYASNLVSGDTNGWPDVFVHDRLTSQTSRVSVDSAGVQGNLWSFLPSISADGRVVAFRSLASNLFPGDTNGYWDVFVHDRATGRTSRVSVDSAGVQANDWSDFPSISADGRFVAFSSVASNLVPGDTNGTTDVFVHDRATGRTSRVSVDSTGAQGNSSNKSPSISADGRCIAFDSFAWNLVPGDTNGTWDVFVHDRGIGQTSRVSADSAGVQGNVGGQHPSISADGRFVAFYSRASNLVPGDTNEADDIFVHDRATGQTTRVSVDSAGLQGNSDSNRPSISADGRFVAFDSSASILVPGDTNDAPDVFVRDLAPVRLARVVPATGSEAGSDYVTLEGESLTGPGPTDVLFGAATAAIVHLTASRILVRTPPGSGVVSVSVRTPCSTATFEDAFTYVAPHLAARYGTVNAPAGYREDVLFVNAGAGDPLTREVVLGIGQPIIAAITSPSTLPQARFALYAWLREPNASTLVTLPRNLGAMVIAPPFLGRTPPVIWNNLGYRRVLGTPALPSRPAPSVLFWHEGPPDPITFTLQGFIEDAGSPIPEGVSVTNALVVHVR